MMPKQLPYHRYSKSIKKRLTGVEAAKDVENATKLEAVPAGFTLSFF